MPNHVHQIGGIGPVKDRERGVEANSVRILPQDASADSMERASPRQIDLSYAHGCASDLLHAAGHIEGGAPGECQQQDPLGINTIDNKVGNSMGQCLCFPCSRAGNHQQRPRTVAIVPSRL